ncbi:DsbA family protein [Natrarchaeobaculum aegyptiacum]|uniref:Disulfide bond formation protein n=1 Tax=Natrarchaeobaculum aegyptiacum TaxID=745377 RepID=A0A2Z2HWD2_9EURY|nr:thioredoxin domain-containing protein [Natrarchaeobaculum aegyptiacum]ARS91659.1 disulfide bond formation protein [Natrarchaeobaculum aegyptiacum]
MQSTRRAFLGATALGLGASLAGCLGSDEPPEPPVAGDPDADVTVTVYEDFSCPACRDFKLGAYPTLREEYLEPGLVRYEHRDFPVVDDSWSWYVPSAAREVYETDGNEAFWEFSSAIYEYQRQYSFDVIEEVADDLGLDGAGVREAAEDETHRDVIEADSSYGQSNGIQGTPTVLVDGQAVEFYQSQDFGQMALEETTAAIDAALE